jgi:hypothetical protein
VVCVNLSRELLFKIMIKAADYMQWYDETCHRRLRAGMDEFLN